MSAHTAIAILGVVAWLVANSYVVLNCDQHSLVGRWCALVDVPTEWVSEYCPPILWPLTWPIFAAAYALAMPLALLSSRLFTPKRFRRA